MMTNFFKDEILMLLMALLYVWVWVIVKKVMIKRNKPFYCWIKKLFHRLIALQPALQLDPAGGRAAI